MTDDPQVGSVAEELAKLIAALQSRQPQAQPNGDRASHAAAQDASQDSSAARQAGAGPGEHEHGPRIADGSAACELCPVCQAIAFVRETSPEVRDLMVEAMTSCAQAVAGLAEMMAQSHRAHAGSPRTRHTPGAGPASGVETIDLAEDEPWD